MNIQTTIRNCARCEGIHVDLEFKQFLHWPLRFFGPQIPEVEFQVSNYSHWAICPTTQEPILMWITKDKQPQVEG